jgi:tetratricopeptide (TPR) repeat protein
MELNRVDNALKVCDKLIALQPNDPSRLMKKGFVLAASQRSEEALKVFDKLIQLQPGTSQNYIGRAQILIALKRNDEALTAIDKATTMDPKLADAWNMKTYLLSQMKKYDEAIISCTRAIEVLSPEHTGYFMYGRAAAYALKGDKANALADLKRAIELQPALEKQATKEEIFKALQDDPEFIKLTELSAQETKGELAKAAYPMAGTWKLNVSKSTIPPGPMAAKEITVVIRELGDQVEITEMATLTNGSPIIQKSTSPKQGGLVKIRQDSLPEEFTMVSTVINAHNQCKTILMDGKQVSVQCSVISKDGKTMTTTIKDMDAKGKSVTGVVVLDKQ